MVASHRLGRRRAGGAGRHSRRHCLVQILPEVPQPPFEDEEAFFKYTSLGAEQDRGMPYYVWLVLPRIFEDKMPGPGGYKSFGFVWEPGRETPVGFAKKTVGFPRVTNNCAICHTAQYKTEPGGETHYVTAGPTHTADLQRYVRFLSDAAKDPRFNPERIMREIDLVCSNKYGHGGLSALDRLLYRHLIIPLTRKALLEQEQRFAWMNRPAWPHWGRGPRRPHEPHQVFHDRPPRRPVDRPSRLPVRMEPRHPGKGNR